VRLHHPGQNAILTLVLLLVLATPTLGQAAAPTALAPDTPVQVRLTGEGPVWLAYEAPADQVVRLVAEAMPDPTAPAPLDPVMEALTPEMARLRYADDTVDPASGARALTATIDALWLQAGQRVLLRVDSFNGVSEGAVTVTLAVIDPFAGSEQAGWRMIALPRGRAYQMTHTWQAGQVLRITARDAGGDIDPALRVLGPDGSVVAFNDDHASGALDLNTLDARLQWTVPATATYTVVIGDVLGRPGVVALALDAPG
jgi:hypothetical protein